MGGFSSENMQKPLGRTILNETITSYRIASGKTAAVASQYPHKFAPLYYGHVEGESIVCRYHGLQFSAEGKCVVNPDGSKAPPLEMKSYPLQELAGVMRVWMGDTEPTKPVPSALDFAEAFGGYTRGYVHVKGNYHLLADNLPDHAHAPHLHAAFRSEALIKNPCGKVEPGKDWVRRTVESPNSPSNPFGAYLRGPGHVDQWASATWQAPSKTTLKADATAAGEPRQNGVRTIVVHLATPETDVTMHYFRVMALAASDNAGFVTGENIAMDGGIAMASGAAGTPGARAARSYRGHEILIRYPVGTGGSPCVHSGSSLLASRFDTWVYKSDLSGEKVTNLEKVASNSRERCTTLLHSFVKVLL